jgi:sulfur carrier protein
MKRMEITVNHQTYSIAGSCSVVQLLTAVLQISESGIAVAVNQSVVSKSDWSVYHLQPGDQVMLIKATQGG